MKRFLFVLNILIFSILFAEAQESDIVTEHRVYSCVEIDNPPKIDALIDDIWNSVEWAEEFTQVEPNPGEKENQETKVKLIYDNDALYVFAELIENEEIFEFLSERDDPGNADWFGIVIDAYNEGTNGLGFFVTPSGVQLDAKYVGQGEDFNWNAVWTSAVRVEDNKWTVEMKIPYAALRFPNQEEQEWGVHFWRNRRVNRELDSWNPVKPEIDGFLNQAGVLKGIKNVKTPLRLQFFPYITLGLDHFPNEKKFFKDLTPNFSVGMDVKYGINDAFTLDMTLIPDFSQVLSDDFVLNLSPFEVRFNENRQFFTEGTELFNKAGLFYSRRIGGTPVGFGNAYENLADNEIVSDNPSSNQLLNATKVSGRTPGGLGIGVFNAFEAGTDATILNTETEEERKVRTSPFTNYNIVVLDQDLSGNSSITMTNTNVTRFDDNFYNANVIGFNSRLNDQNNKYSFQTSLALSQKSGGEFDNPELGYKAGISLGKISGNFLYSFYYGLESDKYDPNDLGLLFSPNEKVYYADVAYNIYKPFWKVNNFYSSFFVAYERLFSPDKFSNFGMGFNLRTTTNKFLTMGTFFNIEPIETFDFFEPRTFDFETYYQYPVNFSWGAFISSNYSKPFALDVSWNFRWFDEPGRYALSVNVSPRFRPNSKLFIVPRVNFYRSINEVGYAGSFEEVSAGIPMGIRNIKTITPILEMDYVLNNAMIIKTRVRHNWTTTRYDRFGYLNDDGWLDFVSLENDQMNVRDVNFHAFTVDLVYRWIFAPGSEMTVVWKNSIVSSEFDLEDRYVRSFGDMIDSPFQKGLSVRILYFMDSAFFNKFKKSKGKSKV